MTEKSDVEGAPHPPSLEIQAPVSSPSTKRLYVRPELTSYERADLGYYSVSNVNAQCQVDCAENYCALIETCTGSTCTECDRTNACGSGDLSPICFPDGC